MFCFLSANTGPVGVNEHHFSYEVAFPYHLAIVLCHLGEGEKKKQCRLYVSAQCMTKGNMFVRKIFDILFVLCHLSIL